MSIGWIIALVLIGLVVVLVGGFILWVWIMVAAESARERRARQAMEARAQWRYDQLQAAISAWLTGATSSPPPGDTRYYLTDWEADTDRHEMSIAGYTPQDLGFVYDPEAEVNVRVISYTLDHRRFERLHPRHRWSS